ncbi:hypothetical protein [Streptomyces mangrovisoli]|uniref:Immunity protein 35 domain-containing protein n=1 Tax=Streptomyces mangrovisoli TaxID=1428628 RepID=A0A1J4NLU8_9ACTN|nr:hypothetical protein [Streptomyces mangrovisoli]OIJ63275.1 hypothetical protein WN71_034950 [Streptomyces mangrovisoli]
MITLDEAERLAAEYLRQTSAGWDNEVALFPEEKWRVERDGCFYFAFQSVRYLETRDDTYFLYGPNQIEVDGESGDCRSLGIQEILKRRVFTRDA